MKLRWTKAISAAMSCGVAFVNVTAQADAPACQMQVHVFAPDARFNEPEDLRTQSTLLFDRLGHADFEKAMQGMQPGEARDESDRFKGQDTRWRLLRPVDTANDPDAFIVSPAQVQYLVRMPIDSQIESLILVGLPEESRVIRPALAGRLGDSAGESAGYLFTAEPKSNTAPCPVNPTEAAEWAKTMIKVELTHSTPMGDDVYGNNPNELRPAGDGLGRHVATE